MARELRKAKKLGQKSPVGAVEVSESSQSSEEETAFSENPGTSRSGVIEEEEEEYWYDTSGEKPYPEESDIEFVDSPATPLSPDKLTSNKWSKSNLFFPEDSIPSPPHNVASEHFEANLRSIEEKSEEESSDEANTIQPIRRRNFKSYIFC